LLLEDAHWLDSASWALTVAINRAVHPLLMVISTRPLSDPLPADYQQLLDHPNLAQINLDSMPADEISHLVCHRLGISALPEQVNRLILQKAEGNPFFSEELGFALRDTGLITIAEGECRIAPNVDLKAIMFPETVQGVITSRIDRLSPPLQMTLKAASVVGRVFAVRLLRDIHPIQSDRSALPDQLETLTRLDLTLLDTPEPDLAYLFKHATTQEVTYNLMLFAQRRDLHRAVAEWYERTYADNLSPHYSVLAYHWQRAAADEQTDPTVSAKAMEYLEKAGDQAVRSYANQEALGYFQDLFQLADARPTVAVSPLQRGRWEGELAKAYLGLGELAESREHFHRALTLLGHPPPVKPLTLAADMLKHTALQTIHRLWPARFVGHARDQREALLEAAHLCQQVAKIYFYFTESFLLLNANLRALNWSEAAGPSGVLAQTYASMCAIVGLLSQHRLAVQYGRLAQVTSQQVNDQPAAGWVFLATGLYYCGIGSWTESQFLLEQALITFARLGDRRQWEESCSVIAPTYYYQGELKISAEYRSKAFASAHERGDHQVQVWGAVGQAGCLIRLGQMDKALSMLELIRPLLGESEDTVWAYGALALAHWRNGDHNQAREAAEAGAQRFNKFRPTAAQVLEGYVDLAEVYLALWEHADARDTTIRGRVKQALTALQGFAKTFPIGRPSLLRLQGLYATLAGSPAKAQRLWRTSLAEAERLSMLYEQALTHYEIGRWMSGGDQQQELHRAQEIFQQLGAAYDVARVKDLL
jgi:tetratricopeptide (TPR) repeat protein